MNTLTDAEIVALATEHTSFVYEDNGVLREYGSDEDYIHEQILKLVRAAIAKSHNHATAL